jgi:hypothetical protein
MRNMKMAAAMVLGGVIAANTLAPIAQASPGQVSCSTTRIGDTESIEDCSLWDGNMSHPYSKTICLSPFDLSTTRCTTSYY